MIQLFITVILIILILVLIVNEFYFYKKIETFQPSSNMPPTSSSTMAPTTSSSNMPPTSSSSNSYPNMCKFVPWGKTINDCTSTCLNSRYKDLYSLGNPNCNIDVCKTTCDDCSTSRCLWTNIPTTPVTNDYNEECININDTQNIDEITITINDAVSTATTSAATTTAMGSTNSYTYIIHYRDTENNNITILNLNNNDNVIFNVSSDVKINHKPKFLKPNKIYNLIMYKMDSNNIKCKSNILNITT